MVYGTKVCGRCDNSMSVGNNVGEKHASRTQVGFMALRQVWAYRLRRSSTSPRSSPRRYLYHSGLSLYVFVAGSNFFLRHQAPWAGSSLGFLLKIGEGQSCVRRIFDRIVTSR